MPNTPYKIINLGDVGWTDLNDAFKNNTALEAVTIGAGINQLTEMINTFNGCINLKEINVVDWDIGNITSLRNFLKNVKLESASYSSMLVHFADSTTINVGVVMHGGDSFFNENAQSARDTLVNVYQWIITDGGLQPVWNQILSTDSDGDLFDLTSNISVPEFTNKRCVEFFGQDYIDTNTKVPDFLYNASGDSFSLSFDMLLYDLSDQFIMGNSKDFDTQGFSVTIKDSKIRIFMCETSYRAYKKSPVSLVLQTNAVANIIIYKTAGDATIYLKYNNTIYGMDSDGSWGTGGSASTSNFIIGKNPNVVSTDYFTGKLSNIHFTDRMFFPFEEKYGTDCCNTVIGELGILNGEIIAQSDVGLMRSTFATSSPEPSYAWKHGYNKIDEFTSAPSLYNKSLASFQIDDAETYTIMEQAISYSWSSPDYKEMARVTFRVHDNQPQADGIIFSLGDKYLDSNYVAIRYSGSNIYCHFKSPTYGNKNTASYAINPNEEYTVAMVVKYQSFAVDIDMGFRIYNSAGTLLDTNITDWNFSGTTFNLTYTNLYFGQGPIDPIENALQDSCLCNIILVSIDDTSDGLGDLLYTDQLLGTYTINDLIGTNDTNVIPRYEIGDCWSRSKDEQGGIYVDCIEYNEINYPACKDGILHNGDEVDFIYTSNYIVESIYLTEDVGDILMGNYIRTGESGGKPYYKHEVNGHYIYYASSMWRIDSTLGSVDTTNIISNSDVDYPPRLPWYLATDLANPITLEAEYIAYPVNDDGTFKAISYSDLVTLTSSDGAIIEKHITDTNVTVVDKLQLIK